LSFLDFPVIWTVDKSKCNDVSIIFFDVVISSADKKGHMGFLLQSEHVNVATTRALTTLYIFYRFAMLDDEYIASFSESNNDPETGEMMPRKLPSTAEYIKRLVAQDLLVLKLLGSVSRRPSTTTGLVLRKILPTKIYWKDLKMREAMRAREKTSRLPIRLKIKLGTSQPPTRHRAMSTGATKDCEEALTSNPGREGC
jgi:hypothetical protein